MNRIAVVLGVVVVLACIAARAESFVIRRGVATVDGVVSTGEWDNANWSEMDVIYSGMPWDLFDASWAAMWDPQDNAIYIAVTGTDTDHVLHEYTTWDGQDCIEMYINARNDDALHFENMDTRKFDDAQQFVIGYDPAVTSLWVVLGGGNFVPTNAWPEMAFGIVSNRLTYEFKLRPYDKFDYGNPTNSTEIRLRAGRVVGLDVVMNSRTSDDGFGMLCENGMGGKFYIAAAMRDYTLGDPEGVRFSIVSASGRRAEIPSRLGAPRGGRKAPGSRAGRPPRYGGGSVMLCT